MIESINSGRLQSVAKAAGAARAPMGALPLPIARPGAALDLSQHMGMDVDVLGKLAREIIKMINHVFILKNHAATTDLGKFVDGREIPDLEISALKGVLINGLRQQLGALRFLTATNFGHRAKPMGMGK
ncbi:MAG: hypothetical protein VKN13_04585 [Cyanobacteriota bacterium]|nr:hypothetical protein [Cyanobacteriota bacterium]